MFTGLLKKISLVLDAGKFPYMIIGGQAVLLYGEPRLTRDIDITFFWRESPRSKKRTVIEKVGSIIA